jgi:D-inositol-3-phosphate glycosyltransferase
VRIALIGPAYPYKGGGARHTTELARRLTAAGHNVVIESWRAPGQQRLDAAEGRPYPRTYHRLAWHRPDGWLAAGRRLRSADLVVFVLLTPIQVPAYLAVLAALRRSAHHRARTAVICHNVLPHERRPGDEALTRAVLRRVDAVLVHTEAEAERAAELTAAPARVAAMAPHLWAAPTRRVRTGLAKAQATRDEPLRRLLFFGLVRPYKGLDVLLRALADGPPDVALTVAGEFWGGVEQTAALVAELGLADRVELRPGYVDAADVPDLFAAADALVLPYRRGTASQNVDLAHLHGRPVVATTVGTLPAAVADGVDGLLVAPGDPAALAAALRRLYQPGVLAGLAAKVRPPDAGGGWDRYLDVLLAAPAVRGQAVRGQ